MTSVEKPSDDLGIFELHLCLFVVCALYLDHIDLINLLFDLFDLFVKTLFIWSNHGCLIVSFELSRLLKQVNDQAHKKNGQNKVHIIDEKACNTYKPQIVFISTTQPLAHPLKLLPLPKQAKTQCIQCLKVVSVLVNIRREYNKQSLSPPKHQHSDEQSKDQDTWSHSVQRVDINAHGCKKLEVAEKLEDAERVEECGQGPEDDFELP